MKLFRKIGPGLITAGVVFGPGSLTVNTKLGAGFGFSLLWVILVSVIFMISFTVVSGKIGCLTRESLMQQVTRYYGKTISLILGLGMFFICASFQAGNSIGAGISFHEIFGLHPSFWIAAISTVAIFILFARNFYRVLEMIMSYLVLLMLLCFLITLFLSRPSLLEMLQGFTFRLPTGSEFLVVALIASSFSIVGAFYQAYLVQAKGWTENQIKDSSVENSRGIVILGFLSALVMTCAAAVLHSKNIPVNHAADLGRALEPLFGSGTKYFFMIGLFAASFTSLLGNCTIGGTLLSDAFGLGHQMDSLTTRMMAVAIIFFGSLVAILFGQLPLQLIVFAQSITVIVAPLSAIVLLLLANRSDIMKQFRLGWKENILPVGGLMLLLFLAAFQIKNLIS